jgi:hypothetical protein
MCYHGEKSTAYFNYFYKISNYKSRDAMPQKSSTIMMIDYNSFPRATLSSPKEK